MIGGFPKTSSECLPLVGIWHHFKELSVWPVSIVKLSSITPLIHYKRHNLCEFIQTFIRNYIFHRAHINMHAPYNIKFQIKVLDSKYIIVK